VVFHITVLLPSRHILLIACGLRDTAETMGRMSWPTLITAAAATRASLWRCS